MPFYFPGFLVGRVLAQKKLPEGSNEVNRLAAIGGLFGPSPAGLLITSTLVDRAAAAAAPAPAPTGEPPPNDAPTDISVPHVVGSKFVDAQKKLKDLDLSAARHDVTSDKPVDEVTAQNPTAGRTTTKEKPVVLDVSKGPPRRASDEVVINAAILSTLRELVTQAEAQQKAGSAKVKVPNVKGLEPDPAAQLLIENDLKPYGLEEESSPAEFKGKVTRTDPPIGKEVDHGSEVKVFIGRGK